MGKADTLEQIASTLRKTAAAYTSKAGQFHTQSIGLAGVVQSLLTGGDRWAGNSSLAFEASFSQSQGDTDNITSALTAAAGHMISLAQTIEINIPAIRAYEVYANTSPSFIHRMTPGMAAQYQQEVENALSQATNASSNISQVISSMSSQVDEEAQKVGVCSTGNGKKEQNGAGTNVYDSGDDQQPRDAGDIESDPNSTSQQKSKKWSILLYVLQFIGTAMVSGAFNSLTNILNTGLTSTTTIEGFFTAALGGMVGTIFSIFLGKMGITPSEHPFLFGLAMAFMGGIIVGGTIYMLGRLIHISQQSSRQPPQKSKYKLPQINPSVYGPRP